MTRNRQTSGLPSSRLTWIPLVAIVLLTTGCCRSRCDMWEDTKSAGRYFNKGLCMLGGDHSCSRQVNSKEEFSRCYENNDLYSEFTPLEDEDDVSGLSMAEIGYFQAQDLPSNSAGVVPGIDAFEDPAVNPDLAPHFQNVNFSYDSSDIRDDEDLHKLQNVSNYMQNHPDLYLFVEGHCDMRGAEAYNLALGARRANTVRNALIDQGVHRDRIFTISHGKDRLLILENHEEAHRRNRRAEFKVYRPS